MNDYKINGIGKFNGGEFDDVLINGISTLHGNLDCMNLKVNGSISSNGIVKVKNGIYINGSAKFKENVKCHTLSLDGSIKCLKSIEAEDVKICGFLTVEEEMNVGNIEFHSARFSIRELHADTIKINDVHKIRSLNKMYEIGEIECTNIDAESLKCKRIFASNVKLGKNANVELVEYSETVDIDPRATVKEVRKV